MNFKKFLCFKATAAKTIISEKASQPESFPPAIAATAPHSETEESWSQTSLNPELPEKSY